MLNYYFKDTIESFLQKTTEQIIGTISLANQFNSTLQQTKSWEYQIPILKNALRDYRGAIFFEFSIPRMGKRIDALVIIENVVFVIEFKVGENKYQSYQIDQVWDYALDLKHFHKPSHNAVLVPILVATEAWTSYLEVVTSLHNDNLVYPIRTSKTDLPEAISSALNFFREEEMLNDEEYAKGSYSPTPTIIEAAVSLYNHHSVEAITRSDAEAINLTKTTTAISEIIEYAKAEKKKVISFVTGVPGAGKTLVGLKVATMHLDKEKGNTSVYL